MITEIIKDSLRENLKGLGINVLTDQISLERPANRDHGDWSSNIALVTAKDAGRQARGLAEEIVNSLTTNLPDGITEVTAAGPGFINFSSLGGVELRNSARGVRKEKQIWVF